MEDRMKERVEEHVVVYDAPDQATAELVVATLKSAGIAAFLANKFAGPASGVLPHLGLAWSRNVLAPASQAQAADQVLAALAPTDAELDEEFEADTMTLEEAEARVKRA